VSSDDELLIRSRTDPTAFGSLFDRHGHAVYGYLARRRGSREAEDLLSEVFLRALEGRHRVRPHESGSALPWLYGIARNLIMKRPQTVSHALGHEPDPFEWSTVDARLDAGAMSSQLRRVLDGLNGTDREVLLLVSWEQLTITEVAETLGISAGAARTRLHRARAHAAAALDAVPHPCETQKD
jgi:RNA polymerase sigma factor (sigma-70 family)